MWSAALAVGAALSGAGHGGPGGRVEELLAKMTLEEKAGQLTVLSRPAGSDYNPNSAAAWNKTLGLIRQGRVGATGTGHLPRGVKPLARKLP